MEFFKLISRFFSVLHYFFSASYSLYSFLPVSPVSTIHFRRFRSFFRPKRFALPVVASQSVGQQYPSEWKNAQWSFCGKKHRFILSHLTSLERRVMSIFQFRAFDNFLWSFEISMKKIKSQPIWGQKMANFSNFWLKFYLASRHQLL